MHVCIGPRVTSRLQRIRSPNSKTSWRYNCKTVSLYVCMYVCMYVWSVTNVLTFIHMPCRTSKWSSISWTRALCNGNPNTRYFLLYSTSLIVCIALQNDAVSPLASSFVLRVRLYAYVCMWWGRPRWLRCPPLFIASKRAAGNCATSSLRSKRIWTG